jgi:hypothetical protein
LRDFPDVTTQAASHAGAVAFHVEIEMPDRQSAFRLEDELRDLYPLAIGKQGAWSVVIDDEEDHLDDVVEASRRWLRTAQLDDLVVRIGDNELHIHA